MEEPVKNIYEAGNKLTQVFFTKKDRTLISNIKKYSEELCHYKIGSGYIHECFSDFTNGIAYLHNELIRGFVLWKEKTITPSPKDTSDEVSLPKKILEGLLICTKKNNTMRIGAQLMNDVEKYSIENKFYAITLIPRDKELLELYKKYGFVIYGFGVADDKPNMRKLVNPIKVESVTETRKLRSHSRKRKRSKIEYYNELLPTELQHELNYEILNNFMKKK